MSTAPQTPAPTAARPAPRRPWGLMLRPYAQLVRLPNVFTAFADVVLGWFALLATGTPARSWPAFVLLLAASGCFYMFGMVWNDYADVEQDRRERPFRPIPSGRVSMRQAATLGVWLAVLGWGFAATAAGASDVRPTSLPYVAGLLFFAILLYDGWLKRTWAGPLGMGACRFLNVFMATGIGDSLPSGARAYLALVVGTYIVGVTWFARTEARLSKRNALAGALAVMAAGLFLGLAVPAVTPTGRCSVAFPYVLVALGFFVGVPAGHALGRPTPAYVQKAVKRALVGLVVLDAALAAGLIGDLGWVILILLVPVLYLGRWIYST